MESDDTPGGLLPQNSLLTSERMATILREQTWMKGDGFVYTKTNGKCLEHIEVAEIVRSLEGMGIYNWSSEKDTHNNVTIMLSAQHIDALKALGATFQTLEIGGSAGTAIER